mgnify:CR=1 FL=1
MRSFPEHNQSIVVAISCRVVLSGVIALVVGLTPILSKASGNSSSPFGRVWADHPTLVRVLCAQSSAFIEIAQNRSLGTEKRMRYLMGYLELPKAYLSKDISGQFEHLPLLHRSIVKGAIALVKKEYLPGLKESVWSGRFFEASDSVERLRNSFELTDFCQ